MILHKLNARLILTLAVLVCQAKEGVDHPGVLVAGGDTMGLDPPVLRRVVFVFQDGLEPLGL